LTLFAAAPDSGFIVGSGEQRWPMSILTGRILTVTVRS
jgi:hypothetical protein